MFIIFNKQKIYSYLVSFTTVIILFVLAFVLAENGNPNTILTSSQNRELPIYSVETEQKKIALTMNCAW